jgi:hypothetical protein
MNQTITEALNQIKKDAQSPLGDIRVIDEFPVGYHVRQGNVYVIRIDGFDKNEYKSTPNRQLEIGVNQNSRHTVPDDVAVFEPKKGVQVQNVSVKGVQALLAEGTIIESKDRFTVMHPQHADYSLPGGTYKIAYQVDGKSQQRVRD